MSKRKNNINELFDSSAERLILSGIIRFGIEVFHDINNIINEQYFFHPENKLIYSAIKQLIVEENLSKPGIASILGLISKIDSQAVNQYSLTAYLSLLSDQQMTKEEIKPFLERVARLGLARNLIHRLNNAIENINETDGSQSILELIQKAEEPIVNFTDTLIGEEQIVNLTEHVMPFLSDAESNVNKTIGIPTGFDIFDEKIGGGLRFPGIHIIGARSGIGKSQICLNIAHNVSKKNIPVLYLDTELTKEQVLSRWVSRCTDVPVTTIETGQFSQNSNTKNTLHQKANVVIDSKQPFYYYNISGKSHQEWLSIARRWLMKIVGFGPNGKINPCLLVFDYIKLMDASELGKLEEYQYLGQVLTDIHNFCVKCEIPCLAAVQLNRDGITKDDTSVIAGSDRILWLCSSFSIMKNKEEQDYADTNNGPQSGNKKLIVVKSRFGPGNDYGEYINLKCDFSRAKIVEGNTNITNRSIRSDLIELNSDPQKYNAEIKFNDDNNQSKIEL